MKNVFYYETQLGRIGIADNGSSITDIFFADNETPVDAAGMVQKETPLIKEAGMQIMEYLDGDRKEFDLPLGVEGTPFQKAAWDALLTIPYGETRSYKQMAELVGNPKACRAIGLANNRNPISIVIPCHRVIGANGKLVGYGGGLHIKEQLLAIEKQNL
ncbi:MAG: methylated-DNA--[protein]-cysteine S-methyltransferase [Clostridiales bacterium]|nr:methylated-DNA--[protein]-cysteine S-methyltransferase [Clostridiales bacterium]